MTAKKKEQSYTDAAAELETLLEEIESGSADIDVLSAKVERAATLIKFCKTKLAGTELQVNKVVEELASDETQD